MAGQGKGPGVMGYKHREGRGPGPPSPGAAAHTQARASQLDRSLELPGALGPGLLGEGPGSVSEEKEMPALPGFPGAAPDLEDWISRLQRGPRC